MGKKYLNTKSGTLEDSILSVWQNVVEELDPVNKKAVKKKFKNRKDKDLDNDGDVDSSDKYLHKRRKAVSKAMDEGKMSQLHQYIKDKKTADEIAKLMKLDVKTIKTLMSNYNMEEIDLDETTTESYEMGTDEYRKHTQEVTPGQEIKKYGEFKVQSMREAMYKVWGINEKKLDKEDEDVVKGNKAMTGGKVAKVDMKPNIED
jgi:methionine synthase II (cobalamin-independent)